MTPPNTTLYPSNTNHNFRFAGHFCTVKNDAAGKRFIRELRKQIKLLKPEKKVKLYGRGHRFGMGRHHVKNGLLVPNSSNRYQSSLPLPKSQRIAVYIY